MMGYCFAAVLGSYSVSGNTGIIGLNIGHHEDGPVPNPPIPPALTSKVFYDLMDGLVKPIIDELSLLPRGTIDSALTDQQWHELQVIGAIWLDNETLDVIAPEKGWGYLQLRGDPEHELKDQDRHAMAALCLYGQSFGFTQEDVDVLVDSMDKYGIHVASLIDRISALLPPPPE